MASESSIDRVAAARELLHSIARDHPPAVFASSFGAEDMVLVDLIARDALPIGVFTLDTGRLPEETHALIDRVRDRYGIGVDVYFPDARGDSGAVRAQHGVNGFYRSVEHRARRAARVRKVEPLAPRARRQARVDHRIAPRAVGRPRRRSARRVTTTSTALPKVQPARRLDARRRLGLPAASTTFRTTRCTTAAIRSIGCAPCTRAVSRGDDSAPGRWWWEQPEHKECGLHRRPVDVTRRSRIDVMSADARLRTASRA